MTVDPRVEAAARAYRSHWPGFREWDALAESEQDDWRAAVSHILAAADAVERPVAQKLADALRSQEHRERTTGVGAGYCLRCFHRWPCKASVVLAEWDAIHATRSSPGSTSQNE